MNLDSRNLINSFDLFVSELSRFQSFAQNLKVGLISAKTLLNGIDESLI